MEKKAEVSHPINTVKKALDKLIDENSLLKMGELKVSDNMYTFSYSQFGTSTGKITLSEKDANSTSLHFNVDLATTHKMVVSDESINSNFDKYMGIIEENCKG